MATEHDIRCFVVGSNSITGTLYEYQQRAGRNIEKGDYVKLFYSELAVTPDDVKQDCANAHRFFGFDYIEVVHAKTGRIVHCKTFAVTQVMK